MLNGIIQIIFDQSCSLQEVIVNFIFLPTIDLLSDPDYINQYIIWMVSILSCNCDCGLLRHYCCADSIAMWVNALYFSFLLHVRVEITSFIGYMYCFYV